MTCMYKPTESSAQPDLHGEYARQKQHLLWMASMPGVQAHAKLRAQALDSDMSGLYRGIYNDVNLELKRLHAVDVEKMKSGQARK